MKIESRHGEVRRELRTGAVVQGFVCSLVFLALLLAGCSGGEVKTSASVAGSSSFVTGVAAAGAPFAGTVFLKDSSSPARELSAPIGADGVFSFNVDGLAAPFLIKAVGTAADGQSRTLLSFAADAGVANVNPLSDLAVVEASGASNPMTLYDTADATMMKGIGNGLSDAVANIQSVLHPTLARFNAATIDFISGPFVADHRGLDLLLELTDIVTSNGKVAILDRITGATVQMPLEPFMTGSVDIVALPTVAGSVCAWPAMPSVKTSGTIKLTAMVIGTEVQEIIWSVVEENGGTIASNGVYSAPSTAGTYHIKATSALDARNTFTVAINVTEPVSLSVIPSDPGQYQLQISTGTKKIAGIDLTITYDKTTLVNPRVSTGSFVANWLAYSNLATAGTIRLVAVSTEERSGSGNVLSMSFDLINGTVGRITGMTVQIINQNGQRIPAIIEPLPGHI